MTAPARRERQRGKTKPVVATRLKKMKEATVHGSGIAVGY
jgi:hypothetical protein